MHTSATRRNQISLHKLLILSIALFSIAVTSHSQSHIDSLLARIDPQKLSAIVEKKVSKLENKIIAKSEKTLRRLEKQEKKIWEKQLETKDSLLAKAKLAEIETKYKSLQDQLKNPTSVLHNTARQYIPHLDTLKTAFKFLDRKGATKNIKDALSKIESFEGKMQQAEEIKKFIRERREQLKHQFEQLGIAKELKKYTREIYYYQEQLKEYKSILSDSRKIEKKAIELLSKTELFKDFMRKNSMLASLFRLPSSDPNDPAYIASLAGLQTRTQVNSLIQNQIASGGPNAQSQFSANIQQAQSQLSQLKNKITQFGGGNSDDIMPEGFKPNNQKTKSFLQRLEYGTNIQTQKATNYYPVHTDIGLFIGYKLNDKSVLGIGANYSIGLGRGWNNIQFSSQGAGLRSYLDWKLKGSFWISGGYEMNYKSVFNSIVLLRDYLSWQSSGLIGLSKMISLKTKFFKKTKLQLLWDFLSYQQVPRAQPIVFRVAYNLK
jgi:hypothetical protein